MDRCTVGRWTHLRTQRNQESGEARKRCHFFGHGLQRKTKKENNLIMDNLQQAPVTQGVNDNKLIAEFMGYKNPSNAADIWYHYDTSWDWLMPVINKIRSMYSTYEVEEVGKYDWDNEISHYEFDLELTYESVVEFIKEYKRM